MKRGRLVWGVGAGAVLLAGVCRAQGTPARLQFSLERAAPPSVYSLTVSESGEGLYTPHVSATLPDLSTPVDGDSRGIRVSAAVLKRLFAAVPMVEGGRCETHNKHIAQTGAKTLHYSGQGRDAQCTYNYSDDDRVNDATTAFEGIAETLEIGERLRAKLRFDRLGLDAEMESLRSAMADGRALEVGNIAPVLKAVAADERVMERVRRRATLLLQEIPPAQTIEGAGASER